MTRRPRLMAAIFIYAVLYLLSFGMMLADQRFRAIYRGYNPVTYGSFRGDFTMAAVFSIPAPLTFIVAVGVTGAGQHGLQFTKAGDARHRSYLEKHCIKDSYRGYECG